MVIVNILIYRPRAEMSGKIVTTLKTNPNVIDWSRLSISNMSRGQL